MSELHKLYRLKEAVRKYQEAQDHPTNQVAISNRQQYVTEILLENLNEITALVEKDYPVFDFKIHRSDPKRLLQYIRDYIIRAGRGVQKTVIARQMGCYPQHVSTLMTVRKMWTIKTCRNLLNAIIACDLSLENWVITGDRLVFEIQEYIRQEVKDVPLKDLARLMQLEVSGVKNRLVISEGRDFSTIEKILNAVNAYHLEQKQIAVTSCPPPVNTWEFGDAQISSH